MANDQTSEPVVPLDPEWPKMSFADATAALTAPGASVAEAELQDWVRARLAAFKVPVVIRFVADTLPRNANGKILKKDLKALFVDRESAAA